MPSTRSHDRFIMSVTGFSFPLPLNFIGNALIIRVIAIYVRNKSNTVFHNNSPHFIFCVPACVKRFFTADVSVSGHFKEFAVLISFSPDVMVPVRLYPVQ